MSGELATHTVPSMPTRVAYTGIDTPSASRHRPSSRLNACYFSGDCTTGNPPRSPTIPRDMTAARPIGSMLLTARILLSANRKSATCAPSGNSTATPRRGCSRATGHAAVQSWRQRPRSKEVAISAVPHSRCADQDRDLAPVLLGEFDGGVGYTGCVDERHEPGQLVGVVENGFPFADVAFDVARHRGLEIGCQAQGVVDDYLAQMIEAAVEFVEPRRGALQPAGSADVVHQEAVDVAHQGFTVEVGGEQLGVFGCHAAVTADVEVPAGLGGDHPDVFAAGLGTLTRTTGYGHLDFMRGPQAAVAQFEVDGHLHGVVLAVAAPVGAHTAFDRAQRFAVGVAGFHSAFDEAQPDVGELVDGGAEHVDALAAGDFGVQPEVTGDLTDQDQLLGRDVAARDPRHHRVGAVALQVGQEVIVGVLQRRLLTVEDVLGTGGGQDRGDGRLADVAAGPAAIPFDQSGEGAQAAGLDDLEQFGAGLGEVLAQRFRDLDAFGGEQLRQQGHARSARGARGGAALEIRDSAGAVGDGRTQLCLGDVVAGADLRVVGQCADADCGPAASGRRDQCDGIAGQLGANQWSQHAVVGRVADQDAAE